MGIFRKNNNLDARMRLFMIKAAIVGKLGKHAKIKFSGKKIKAEIKTEIELSEKTKEEIEVEYESEELIKLLLVSDDEFDYRMNDFVYRFVDETKQRVQREAASKVLVDYYWRW